MKRKMITLDKSLLTQVQIIFQDLKLFARVYPLRCF